MDAKRHSVVTGMSTETLTKRGDPFIPGFVLSVDPEFSNLAIYRWRADQHCDAQRRLSGRRQRNRANFSHPNVAFNSPTVRAISETPDISDSNPRLGEGGSRVV